ncbi:exopolysaccharide transport family protein [Pedobacter sp. MW01-1-1]|uniref:exopolysaccharide transport family protein n=1 Tax=Pedobacter sp. MW01-1-1 TaxID=3383027 RepID=UPI003FEFE743
MDIQNLLKLLNKYKWVLVIVPIVAVTVTYFSIKNLPSQYTSSVQISTGLLDPSKKVLTNENIDFFTVSQQFNNIMQKFKMKKIINILSYNLILHDLENPKGRFRPYSLKIDSLTPEEKSELISLFKEKLATRSILTVQDNKAKYPLFDIVEGMGYGEGTLKKQIEVNHAENSDFIDLSFTSENPNLSVYLVNTLAADFISIYSSEVSSNQNSSLVLLDSLLKKKEFEMNTKNAALASFKQNKGVLNLNEQSATVYAQITDYETKRANFLQQIQSNQGALSVVLSKLEGSDPYLKGSLNVDNRQLVQLKRELQQANEQFVDGGFKLADQRKVDSLTRLVNLKTIQNSDDNVIDPTSSRQSLVGQKLNLEVGLKQAQSSIKAIDKELTILRDKYNSMVPYDANIQNYQRDADLATKEYMTALDQYNQNRAGNKTMGLKLTIEEPGFPGNPLPSKRLLYLASAGLGSFILTLGILLLIVLLDTRIKDLSQLQRITKEPGLASLNKLSEENPTIVSIWNKAKTNKEYEEFKEELRSLRFEVSRQMNALNAKILGVTSINPKVGKTFIASSLAYSLALTAKKVLLITDEGQMENVKGLELSSGTNFNNFIVKREINRQGIVTVMRKDADRESLLESQTFQNLKAGFEVLKDEFDYIVIDIDDLGNFNISKEWLILTEANIAVFEYSDRLKESQKMHLNYLKTVPGFLGWVLNKTVKEE